MRRLFWHVFINFIATYIVTALILTWFTPRWFERTIIPHLDMSRLQIILDGYNVNAARALERDGIDGLKQWVDAVNEHSPVRMHASVNNNAQFIGDELPEEIIRLLENSHPDKKQADILRWLRIQKTTYAGQQIIIIAWLERMLVKSLMNAQIVWMQAAIMLTIAMIAGWFLAWYIATPLQRIQSSARRYAEGDLDARVGELTFGRSKEIVALASEFDRMSEKIKSLVESYQGLIRDVSHELRSPLARLNVALELARNADSSQVNAALERIESEANRLEDMLRQTIELSKLQTTAPANRDLIAVDELLKEIVTNADYEGQLENRRVCLTEVAPMLIRGEYDALYSAFENVTRNAVRYTKPLTTVEVSLKKLDSSAVQICVRDRGPGLSESDLTRIFEPFYRADSARSRASGGVGLGLAITYTAVQRHQGQISARNRQDGGLEITITLPMNT